MYGMLQPDMVRLLTEGPMILKNRDEVSPTGNTQGGWQNDNAEGNPFTFAPHLLHLHKDHELFEDGDIQRHMHLQDLYISETDDKQTLRLSDFACHISGCNAFFKSLEEYEHHYNSLHRHICCSCRRSLPSARLLDIHIQEWHDTLFTILAQRQDMYLCLVEGCGQKFRTTKHRKDHLIRIHKYPPDFRFDKTKKVKGRTLEQKRRQQRDAVMEAVDVTCKSEVVCEVTCDDLSDQLEYGESMEMNVSEEEAAHIAKSPTEEYKDVSAAAHSTVNTSPEPPKPRYSYRVPANVCFGHGSIRGFTGRRGRRK